MHCTLKLVHFYPLLVFTLFTLCNAQSADLRLCNAKLYRYGFKMLRLVAGGAEDNDDVLGILRDYSVRILIKIKVF